MKRLGQVAGGLYFLGYWYYLLSTAWLGVAKLGWFSLAPWIIPQAFIAMLWPVWLWIGYRPWLP